MSGEVGERGRFVYFCALRPPGRAPRHGDRAVRGRRAQGHAVPHDPRGLGRLGRQGSGAALPRPVDAVSRSSMDNALQARYLIETPLDPAQVAEVLAGEQSSGTFVRVAGEATSCARAAAHRREHIEELEPASVPACPAPGWSARAAWPWRRARITVAFPARQPGRQLCRRSPPPWPAISTTSAKRVRSKAPRAAGRLARALRAPAPRRGTRA